MQRGGSRAVVAQEGWKDIIVVVRRPRKDEDD